MSGEDIVAPTRAFVLSDGPQDVRGNDDGACPRIDQKLSREAQKLPSHLS